MIVLIVKNSYIEYRSKGDRYENLSPKGYLDMIRPYLRALINDHKTPMKLTDNVNNNDTEFGERKIQLVILFLLKILKKFVLYIQQVIIKKLLWVVTQMMSLINFLILFYKDFNKQEKHQMKEEANLCMKMLVYCIIIFIK